MNQNIIQQILNRKLHKQSITSTMFKSVSFYFWLYCLVRKKSHRVRINSACKILNKFKTLEFQRDPGRVFAYVRKIDPFVFEELLLLAFSGHGLKVRRNKRYTGDGGIDGIVILPNKKRYAIQAKRYQKHINASHIDDFSSVLKKHACHGGFFIHCGKSGKGVYERLLPEITLISGSNLHLLLTGCQRLI